MDGFTSANILFLIIGSILIIGFFADYIFKKYKIPDAIILLLVGLFLSYLGYGKMITLEIIPTFSALALMFILFEVGTELKFYSLIKEIPKASFLAFVVFFISMITSAFISVFVSSMFGFTLNFEIALLLGAIIGGSSSVIVAPMASKLEISKNTKSLLTIESAITDALSVLIAITLLRSFIITGSMVFGKLPTEIISSFSIAIVLGFIFGLVWLNVLPKVEKYEYYYLLTIGVLFFVYSLTEMVGGVGAISSLVFGIVLGNASHIGRILYIKDVKPLTPTTNTFHKLIVFIIRTLFFVILGLMITISNYMLFLFGIFLTFILFAIRYIFSRVIVLEPNKMENDLIAIMMPRGLAAAVLAPIPYVQYKIAQASLFPDIVFSVILVSSLIAFVGVKFLNYKTKNKV